MDTEAYWQKKLAGYANEDWATKPSIFAQWALQHFPAQGALLELGAGHGQDSAYFAEQGWQATCTDFDESIVDGIRRKYGDKLQYQVVDLSQTPLPFDDASFDVVYAHLSLHYFDRAKTQELFREIGRILKSGGVLAALFNTKDDPEYGDNEKIEDGYVMDSGIYKRFMDADDARAFAEGFEVVVADNQGTTLKDEAKGVHNLIRLIARKPA
ncbi:class I SAM-dependent methyltransferase [Candidatus Saccharibacteria bacterium]|nr:class I SAM-dependent methyltransferase [Candidatus Saccharibacteria bacterium]